MNNSDYPLELGYIGLVCGPKSHKESYASFSECQVGTSILRKRLCSLLQSKMINSLDSISEIVSNELLDTDYQLQVEFNDKEVTPYSYMIQCIEELKKELHGFQDEFQKPMVKEGIKSIFMNRISQLCRSGVWNVSHQNISQKEFQKESQDSDPLSLTRKQNVDDDFKSITKSGVGKISVQYVHDMLISKLNAFLNQMVPWIYHESARDKIIQIAHSLIQEKTRNTIHQIENMMKPFKESMDYSGLEWKQGQIDAIQLLDQEIQTEKETLESIQSSPLILQNGKRQLRYAIRSLSFENTHPDESVEFHPDLFETAQCALKSEKQITWFIDRKRCIRHCQEKSKCPEVYLSLAVEKIAYISLVFIYYELINEFFTCFPKVLESELLK